MANIYASIMYTQSRYGSLSAWGRAGGYDVGNGKRWPSGTMGYNASGEDEYVWRGSQLASAGAGGVHVAPGAVQVTVDASGAADPDAVERAVHHAVTGAMDQLIMHLHQGAGVR